MWKQGLPFAWQRISEDLQRKWIHVVAGQDKIWMATAMESSTLNHSTLHAEKQVTYSEKSNPFISWMWKINGEPTK